MKYTILAAALIMVLSTSVQAQTLQLRTFCDETGVPEATYQPNVDIDGNPVTPANLNENMASLKYPIEIPLKVEDLKWLNLNVLEGINAEPEIATVALHEDGHITYNGQDISAHVTHLCTDEVEKTEGIQTQKEGIEVELLGEPAVPDTNEAATEGVTEESAVVP